MRIFAIFVGLSLIAGLGAAHAQGLEVAPEFRVQPPGSETTQTQEPATESTNLPQSTGDAGTAEQPDPDSGAQSGASPETAGGDADAAEGEPAAAAPPPDYNGRVSGTVIDTTLNAQVVCTREGGTLLAQSDPGEDPRSDTNGDATIVDLRVIEDGGVIDVYLQAGSWLLTFDDTGAVVDGNRVSYAVTAAFMGSPDERIALDIECG
ncbi:MAG: hypothetical protein AAGE76_02805 [Pseudomonadota bacterium]